MGYSTLHKLHEVQSFHTATVETEICGYPEAEALVLLCQVSQNKACLWQNQRGCCSACFNLEVVLHNLGQTQRHNLERKANAEMNNDKWERKDLVMLDTQALIPAHIERIGY